MQAVGAAYTRKLFEKSLTKNFTKVVFCLASCLNYRFVETPLRWPRQDDGAASGSRGKLTRVKPGELSPGLRDGEEAARIIAGRGQTQSSPAASRRGVLLFL
jgi:hypothetical protein